MHPVGARVKEIALMREYTGSKTQAFLPVRLAELHSAVRTKAIARALAKQRVTNPLGAQADGLCSTGR
jgi:hypothetical protein